MLKFHGFQKLTLLDYPGKVAATLFTAGCNFRCPFCHNAALVTHIEAGESYTEDEVLSYLEKRRGILEGICLTGGEPLLQKGVEAFLARVKSLGYAVKLDTNGSFPDRLAAMIEAGLVDHVAMDIKNAKEKYPLTVGLADFDLTPIEKSVALLLQGRVSYEFRTTVVKELHTPEDIDAIGKWIAGAEKYFLQGFIDSGDLICSDLSAESEENMRKMCEIAGKYVKKAELRGI